MIDPSAHTFGLPPCLRIPIAAADVEAIKTYVGSVLKMIIISRGINKGRINAVFVRPYVDRHTVEKTPGIQLWKEPLAALHEERLFPDRQLWVHVDFAGYRKAYREFGMPSIPEGYFLDHIQNREAIRLGNYHHPFLRLCPISRYVNTIGGSDYGGEGMEKQFLRNLSSYSAGIQSAATEAMQSKVTYADPDDLTKMLNIAPGTGPLPGVRDTQYLFFPPR